MLRHDGHVQVRPLLLRVWMPTRRPFRSRDAADRLAREQLVAAGMQPADRGDRQARIQMIDDRCRRSSTPKSTSPLAIICGVLKPPARFHVLDVREAFGAQERFGHVERGEADRGRERQADRGRFRRPLVGKRSPRAKDARGAGGRQAGQEIAAISVGSASKPPLLVLPPRPLNRDRRRVGFEAHAADRGPDAHDRLEDIMAVKAPGRSAASEDPLTAEATMARAGADAGSSAS